MQPMFLQRLIVSVVIAGLLCAPFAPVAQAQEGRPIYLPLIGVGKPGHTPTDLLFRTRISVNTSAQWRTLEKIDPLILIREDDGAVVMVDDHQLEALARLRFNPMSTDGLEDLVGHNLGQMRRAISSLDALLAQAATVKAHLDSVQAAGRSAIDIAEAEANELRLRTELRAALHTLDGDSRLFLAVASNVDSDGDGLTDTEERWWCTNPNNPDSNENGISDDVSVMRLREWMNHERSAPPASGPPFRGWPMIPGRAEYDPDCIDVDQDSVPDLAERWVLGLNSNRESTTGDKFDDGQKLFGITYCPGSGAFCGYGVRPRNEDWGTITSNMPSWVKAPGNHPLVAAYPVPEVEVIESSIWVERVTTITTEKGEVTQTTKSYSTAKTTGTSTSVADTELWNEWQETSISQTSPVSSAARAGNTGVENAFKGEINANASAQNCISASAAGAASGALIGGGASAAGSNSGCVNVNVGKLEGSFSAVKELTIDKLVDFRNNSLQFLNNMQNSIQTNIKNSGCIGLININCGPGASIKLSNEQSANLVVQANGSQDRHYNVNQSQYVSYPSSPGSHIGDIAIRHYQPLVVPLEFPPTVSESSTNGKSFGGSRTTTTEKYEEHTITNGEAFTTGENWSTATAVNSAHAADLRFTYKVRNAGTEYARQIKGLTFNIYIGEDPNPVCTYSVGSQQCGVPVDTVLFENFMPNAEHIFTSAPIPLTLEQMKAIDLGGPLRIVVENFSYGIDELFYQNAASSGLLIAIEDGTFDNIKKGERIDTYLIPTWGEETVLDVLARYFPHQTDSSGMLTAIWTPQYRTDNPAWCQDRRRPKDVPSRVVWCKHELSTADWWNVYTNGLGDGSEGFQDTQAVPGAVALFRFNKDTDRDGFSDRTEHKLGTDPNDASSFPQPELLAGIHQMRSGSGVTATLSLLNTGLYDAYGVEAIMVAQDDSISIINNTVGGSGRVRALKEVVVGSRIVIQQLGSTPWSGQNNHAVPAAAGYYTGSQDRTYTFSVANCGAGGCDVGSGNWTLNWNDGRGSSGGLNYSDGYASPTFLPVGNLGLTLALYSGKVNNGESFTVQARIPRDTFQYTINREPYTPPLVIVSYNDPQGNHRFVVPPQAMNLAAPTDDLAVFAGQMLDDVGVELVTRQTFTPGANSLDLLVNNPTAMTLVNAHLFLEFVNISGTVVSEVVQQVALPSGPSYTEMSFDSASFDPPYNPDEDYIVLAFLTDYEGNILDTAGRPLSSFQPDPMPQVAGGPVTWDVGTVAQGDLRTYALPLANIGFGRLYTYLQPVPGFALDRSARTVGAADMVGYDLVLRTEDLPLGLLNATLTLATSDPDNERVYIEVSGEIVAATGDLPASPVLRPLDVAVTVEGPKNAGDAVEFSHNIGPQPETMHPCKIFNSDYGTLYGVGERCTDFSSGTASAETFGNGADGNKTVNGEEAFDAPRTPLGASVSAGATSVNLGNATGFNVGDELLIIQIQGSGAGNYEFRRITAKFGNTLTLNRGLDAAYSQGGNNRAQIVRVPNYQNVNITSSGRWRAPAWDGSTGGILIFRVSNSMVVISGGIVDASGRGFRGAPTSTADTGRQGEGQINGNFSISSTANGMAGGGGWGTPTNTNRAAAGGGGGGHATVGIKGTDLRASEPGGAGGGSYGLVDLSHASFGGGGGAGGAGRWDVDLGGAGGTGGGIIAIYAKTIDVSQAYILSRGANGATNSGGVGDGGGGGGGAGGSILVKAQIAVLGNDKVVANGGSGGLAPGPGTVGGAGGQGRIRIEYCDTLSGATIPAASAQKLNCYIAAQGDAPADSEVVSSASFGDGRDGVMPSSGNLNYDKGFGIGNVNGTQGATTIAVIDRHNVARIKAGDVVLIHQTRGSGAGQWELNKAATSFTGSGTFSLETSMKHNYVTNGANERAQILRVPQYTNCPVTGTVTPLSGWNDNWGGIFIVMCQNELNISGSVISNGGNGQTATSGNPAGGSGGGFRGGIGDAINNDNYGGGWPGEGTPGNWIPGPAANGNGGGAGSGTPATGNYGTGGGGGNGSVGGASTSGGIGPGGSTAGTADLRIMVFGGGGGGSNDNPGNSIGGGGGGGGIVILYAKNVNITGSVQVNGGLGGGDKWGAGSGAGGSILVRGENLSFGPNGIQALGGAARRNGGAGGVGRIRAEYCESISGTTNPPASTQQLICYSAEQGPPGYASFRLPVAVANGTSTNFPVQFARHLPFAATGEQVTTLRIPAGPLYSAHMDLLLSGAGSGDVTVRLDIADNGSWDWEKTASVSNSATWTSINLAEAFNEFWTTNSGRPTTGTIDVPVRVSLSKPAQSLISNLQISQSPSVLRTLDLKRAGYNKFLLDLFVENNGQPYTLAIDVGNNGTVDWAYSGTSSRLLTGDLRTVVNAFLNGQSSSIVPMRLIISADYSVTIYGYEATPKAATDLTASAMSVGSVARAALTLREGDVTTVSATVQNGSGESGPVTVAFFAGAEGWGDWYIGSTLVPSMPPGTSLPVSVEWNTTGFSGNVPVKAVVNPYGRTAETNTSNNVATTSVMIEPPLLPPVADFNASPTICQAPCTVQFSDASVSSSVLTGWLWDFGDSGMDTIQHPSYTYTTSGIYTVTLTVIDAGGSDTKVRTSYIVVDLPPPPVADFSANPTACMAPCNVQFSDTSTGNVGSWQWNFGDGQSSSEQHPQHTYTNEGTYTVSLTVSGPGGQDIRTRFAYIVVNAEVLLPLSSGWNLIALPLQPEDTSVATALGSIADRMALVYAYQGCDDADPWKKYDPSAPAFVNDLKNIDEAMGLWVRLTQSGTLSVRGSAPSAQSIPLCEGWNLVGFPATEAQPVATALASIAGCYSIVYTFRADDVADPWKKYDPSAPSFANDLTQMEPGQGYWIRATQTCTWTIGE